MAPLQADKVNYKERRDLVEKLAAVGITYADIGRAVSPEKPLSRQRVYQILYPGRLREIKRRYNEGRRSDSRTVSARATDRAKASPSSAVSKLEGGPHRRKVYTTFCGSSCAGAVVGRAFGSVLLGPSLAEQCSGCG